MAATIANDALLGRGGFVNGLEALVADLFDARIAEFLENTMQTLRLKDLTDILIALWSARAFVIEVQVHCPLISQ
jgi:hypothetical protein